MKIIGYGACMISGYPFDRAKSFFSRMLAKVFGDSTGDGPAAVRHELISHHRFSAERAAHHVHPRVTARHPDIVVLQFGSTDVDCPPVGIFGHGPPVSKERSVPASVSERSPSSVSAFFRQSHRDGVLRESSVFDQIRWLIATILGFIARPQPNSDLDVYLDAMTMMVETLSLHHIEVILLAPFPFAMKYTHRLAKIYTAALLERFRDKNGVHVVDCIALFRPYRSRQILMSDGMHLNEKAHEVLGDHLSTIVLKILVSRRQQNQPNRSTE